MPNINTSSIIGRTKIFDFANVSNGEHKDAHTVKIVQNSSRFAAGGEQENAVIEGFMREPINFDFKAQWEKKDGIISNLMSSELANAILSPAERVGFGATHAGYVTKKYYTGGTDLSFNINMRIVDYQGTGEVLIAVSRLAALMLPKQNMNTLSINGLLPDQARKAQENAQAAEQTASNSSNAVVAGLGSSGLISSTIAEITDAGITPTSAPTPVAIFIGEYIMHEDMVITNCNVTFSKELVEVKKVTDPSATDEPADTTPKVYSAPLYVDVNLGVTSRENLYLTQGKNEAKGTYINSMVWGYDAKVQRMDVSQNGESGPAAGQ